jgi:hypothetical protein
MKPFPGDDERTLVLQILVRESNAAGVVSGCGMNYCEVRMSIIWALGLYILARFEHAKEDIEITEV